MKRLLALILVLPLASCSTIFNGTSEDIEATSNPPGADVFLNGKPAGVTPCELTLDRTENHFAEFTHKDHPGQVLKISFERHFNGATFGNLLLGGLIGAGVDAASGANYSFSPDPVHADFMTQKIGDPKALNKSDEQSDLANQ